MNSRHSLASNIEHRRLSRQCEAILQRLQQGRVSNTELSHLALKYTSRISDLRERGYRIVPVSQDRKTGVTFYELQTTAEPRQVGLW